MDCTDAALPYRPDTNQPQLEWAESHFRRPDTPSNLSHNSTIQNEVTPTSRARSQPSPKKIVVGSRKSQLAMIQTHSVVKQLTDMYGRSAVEISIESMSTAGDLRTDIALHKINEKNLWTKELEVAMLNKHIAFAVHSLKDLPSTLPDGLAIAAILRRENAQDAVVLHPRHTVNKVRTLAELPAGSVLGTSSLRRAAELKRTFPHLTFKDVRGNLNTRIAKLDDDSSGCDALILAAAGLIRMSWTSRIAQILSPQECMHAVGQGALAIECVADDVSTVSLLEPLNDLPTVMACLAERAFLKHLSDTYRTADKELQQLLQTASFLQEAAKCLKTLFTEGGCSVPCAVTTNYDTNSRTLTMRGGVYSLDGAQAVEHTMEQVLPEFGQLKVPQLIHDDEPVNDTNPQLQLTGYVVPLAWQSAAVAAHTLGVQLAQYLQTKGATEILVEARRQSKVLQKLHDVVLLHQQSQNGDSDKETRF